MTNQPDQLVWTDIETTGLEVGTEVLLEVGFVLTDLNLNILDEVHWVLWDDAHQIAVDRMPEFVREMHTKNGLLAEAKESGIPCSQFTGELFALMRAWGINSDDPLCGSTVQFDRAHLTHLDPESMDKFSYRNIDVSSFKETVRRYKPAAYNRMQVEIIPRKKHRTKPDLRDTLEEFNFYTTVLGLR